MTRPRVRHELKTWPEFFAATRSGKKKFELRRNDRPDGFQVGDELLLKEWDPVFANTLFSHTSNQAEAIAMSYTGREVLVRVDYIMSPAEILQFGVSGFDERDAVDFVIMSVSLVN